MVETWSPTSSTMPTYSCPIGEGPPTASMPRYGHRSEPHTQAADSRITASVGSTMVGRSRSSTRTSPGPCRTAPRMRVLLVRQVSVRRSGPTRAASRESETPRTREVAFRGGRTTTCLGPAGRRSVEAVDNRSDIRDFLATRRARLSPEQVGLAAGGGRRRVPGLRREEVAVLAGVSTEWYTRLEKGHISGVSDDVLEAVSRALQLTEEERAYLRDLARAARKGPRSSGRRREADLDPSWQWMLDSMTMCAALVRNGRLDLVESNSLARALHAPMFDSHTVDRHGRPNFARYFFLDPGSHEFFIDWDGGAEATTALLRAEAG